MARREYAVRFNCGHPGCGEFGHYSCNRRAEVVDLQKLYYPDKWRCVRHTQPGEVLSLDIPALISELSIFVEPHGKYWGTVRASSGFVYGPGFKAYANDFPEGTRLRITAEIVLPTPKQEDAM